VSSITHVERDRKFSTASTKISTSFASQSHAETEKERRTREAEREKAAAAEALQVVATSPAPAAKEQEKGKGKGKTPKNTSKPNSPIDLADTTVGKSPGQLANALTMVWGSQSKAATPAASPFPPSRSVGPTTPKHEAPPPPESRKSTRRNSELKFSTPATPALGEANSYFSDPPAEEVQEHALVSRSLALEVPPQDTSYPEETTEHTPADTVPPEQLTSGTPGDLAVSAQLVESTAEQTSEFSAFQLSSNTLEADSTPGVFDTFGADDEPPPEASAGTGFGGGWGSWGSTTEATDAKTTDTKPAPAPTSWGGPSWSFPSFGAGSLAMGFGGDDTTKEIELDKLQSTAEHSNGELPDAAPPEPSVETVPVGVDSVGAVTTEGLGDLAAELAAEQLAAELALAPAEQSVVPVEQPVEEQPPEEAPAPAEDTQQDDEGADEPEAAKERKTRREEEGEGEEQARSSRQRVAEVEVRRRRRCRKEEKEKVNGLIFFPA
jgi:hypothetical protein